MLILKSTKVILISAKARHGKDSAAKILQDLLGQSGKTVLICHFADCLKMLCQNSYGWVQGDKGSVGRTILQNVATDYRNNNPDCWANIVKQIAISCPEEYVIIPDCRYQNEPKAFCDMDTTVIRIERPNFDNGLTDQQKNHLSEIDMDHYKFDKVIINDGTLENLKEKIKQVFQLEVE